MPYMTVRTADVEGPLFLRKFGGPFWFWPASSAVIRCPGIAWSAGWAGSALWEPPSARRRCPSTDCRRASSRARWPEGLHRHDRRQRVLPGSGTCRGGRERQVEGRLPSLQRRGLDSPQTLPRPSAPMAGRGRKRPGRCCLRGCHPLCFLHGWLKIRDRPTP